MRRHNPQDFAFRGGMRGRPTGAGLLWLRLPALAAYALTAAARELLRPDSFMRPLLVSWIRRIGASRRAQTRTTRFEAQEIRARYTVTDEKPL